MKQREVALLIETSNGYARGLVEGIIRYIREHHPWSVYLPEQGRRADAPAWLSQWRGDGIIARIETQEIANIVKQTGLPVVDVSAARLIEGIPWAETDDSVIAGMAAQHLLERGFRNLAFCGDASFNWSVWREQHFVAAVRQHGYTCHTHSTSPAHGPGTSWSHEKKQLAKWLQKLPRPVGIFACYDIRAQLLLDICRELNISVPEEMAVLGVDNDRLLCDLATPPLSSVIPNAHHTGYLAAELLDRMMSGESVPPEAHRVRPLGVQTRQSTDILAIDDPHVAAALRFIRARACQGINVSDVLDAVPLSRRALESRFRKILGRTPHEELIRLRIDRVRQLLSETELSLAEIADLAGFTHVEYLSVAFKRETGLSPREFRNRS
ncbi:substrate-binding domain-containing protein [Planctomicrobium sp. SH661]|uniref:XylR family transcriptional regulator n=1 Tax=Planctomicrobium sp. SH661 TaxID=3448124 RepID=UPI003F5C159B